MELSDILTIYLERKGYRAADDKLVPWDVIMPTLIMDVCYTTYEQHLSKVRFVHEERKFANTLSQHVNLYFRDFWRIWRDEEVSFIIDMMERFQDYIHRHVEILYNVIWMHFERFGDVDRVILSRIMLCNILAQAASYVQKHVFGKPDNNIEKAAFYSQRLLYAIGDKRRVLVSDVDFNSYKDIHDAVVTLINKIAEFRQKYKVC